MVTELGATLKPDDNRIKYLQKLLIELPHCVIKREFE